MALESATVVVKGLRLHYLRQGQGQPILLLHGWPTHSYIWRHLIPTLSHLGAVYALDLPGFGASDKPRDGEYTFTWLSLFVEGFVDALGLDGITLIAHDIGAPTGVLWASRHPERIRSLVLLNAPIFPWRTLADRVSQLLLRTPLVRSWLVSPAGLALLLRTNVVSKAAMPADVIREYQAPFSLRQDRHLLLRTILSPLKNPASGELSLLYDKIAAIPRPIAIIYGKSDSLCGSHMQELARRLTRATVFCFENCGHYVQEDCPERLEDALVRFFHGRLIDGSM